MPCCNEFWHCHALITLQKTLILRPGIGLPVPEVGRAGLGLFSLELALFEGADVSPTVQTYLGFMEKMS